MAEIGKDGADGLTKALSDPGFAAFIEEQYSAYKAQTPAAPLAAPDQGRQTAGIKTVLDQKLADPSWPDDLKIETSIVLKKKTWKQLTALMAAHSGEREWRTLSGSIWQLVQNAYLNRAGRQKAKEAAPKAPSQAQEEAVEGDPTPEPGCQPLQMRDLK
jgi:hypothetical protein